MRSGLAWWWRLWVDCIRVFLLYVSSESHQLTSLSRLRRETIEERDDNFDTGRGDKHDDSSGWLMMWVVPLNNSLCWEQNSHSTIHANLSLDLETINVEGMKESRANCCLLFCVVMCFYFGGYVGYCFVYLFAISSPSFVVLSPLLVVLLF